MDEFFVEDALFSTLKFRKYNFAVRTCKELGGNVCMHGDVIVWSVNLDRLNSDNLGLYFFNTGGGLLLRKDFFSYQSGDEISVIKKRKPRKKKLPG
jgi:hypothetical protein